MRRVLTTLVPVFLLLFQIGCAHRRLDVDGNVAAERINLDHTVIDRTVDFENPILTGLVEAHGLTLSGDTSCCSRLRLEADSAVFVNPDLSRARAAFLSVTAPAVEFVGTGRTPVWPFKAPAISMPTDGRTVRLRLINGDREQLAANVSLSDAVIVLPVHLHLFLADDEPLPRFVSKGNSLGWFERPSVPAYGTSAVTVHDSVTGTDKSFITTTNLGDFLYENVDQVWRQAGIQFSLESFGIIRDQQLSRQVVTGDTRTLVVSATHRERATVPGIHIYLGRNSENLGRGGFSIINGQTSIVRCIPPVSASTQTAIALAWDTEMPARAPSLTLAHELGHYLGLDHTEDAGACGRDLVAGDDGLNLMTTMANGSVLTPAQIDRARALACAYLSVWRLSSRACD